MTRRAISGDIGALPVPTSASASSNFAGGMFFRTHPEAPAEMASNTRTSVSNTVSAMMGRWE